MDFVLHHTHVRNPHEIPSSGNSGSPRVGEHAECGGGDPQPREGPPRPRPLCVSIRLLICIPYPMLGSGISRRVSVCP